VKLSRRRFLQVGLLGAGALVLARVAYRVVAPPARTTPLTPEHRAIVAAIVPVLLANALPADDARRAEAIEETVSGVATAIAGLPAHAQKELDDLFSLLAFAPSRALLAGVWSPWERASRDDVIQFLAGWRASRFSLFQSAYQALHQLTYAAWYGNPGSWQGIGYAGPPRLTS